MKTMPEKRQCPICEHFYTIYPRFAGNSDFCPACVVRAGQVVDEGSRSAKFLKTLLED